MKNSMILTDVGTHKPAQPKNYFPNTDTGDVLHCFSEKQYMNWPQLEYSQADKVFCFLCWMYEYRGKADGMGANKLYHQSGFCN